MITFEQRQSFEAYYTFMDFQAATGLQSPALSKAYNAFRDFTMQYIKDNGFEAITEAFEVWSKDNLKD